MRILVSYDVNTTTPEGERRLRRVARVCVDVGQRVQKSVFECSVNEGQLEQFRRRLLAEINLETDSLRIYRLPDHLKDGKEVYGNNHEVDFDGPLVI